MFNNYYKATPGAARVGSVSSRDNDELDWTESPEFSQDQKDARMVNAIFSAAVVLQDASVSNGILNGMYNVHYVVYVMLCMLACVCVFANVMNRTAIIVRHYML
jgi:hypothetical protein